MNPQPELNGDESKIIPLPQALPRIKLPQIGEDTKEEIRDLRRKGFEVKEIYDHMRAKGVQLTPKQCSAIAAWESPTLSKKRGKKMNLETISNSGALPPRKIDWEPKREEYVTQAEQITMNMNPEYIPPSWINNEGPEITKAEAVQMLREGFSPKKMAGYFKGYTEGQLQAFAAHIEMKSYDKNPELLLEGGKSKPIRKKEDLVPFLKENQVARDFSLLALTLGPDGGQIEEAILHLYGDKFKSRDELHSLLEETKEEFAKIMEEGVTNLGMFLGGYTLFDRGMAPIILGGAIEGIPLEKSTPPLEKLLLRVAAGIYDPLFNKDTDGTILDLEGKAQKCIGIAPQVYGALAKDYRYTLSLMERLKKYDALREKFR